MILKSIKLQNFRLHTDTKLEFSEELNYIIGGNGQGKTSILEAIYYLCTTKSLNQSSDNEAVNFENNFFNISGFFEDISNSKVLVNYFQDVNKKSVFVDDKQIYRAASVIGKFPVVTLIQTDHEITQGSPSVRRKFVDSVISQSSETYLKIFLDYSRTLKQRSSLLSRYKETGDASLIKQIAVWTETLVKYGTEIVKHRLKFIEEFDGYVKETYKKIMDNEETPRINYSFLGETDQAKIEDVFNQSLSERQSEELRRATNLVGPHRDDFYFSINELELKKFGSQGQHKTFQVALRFAQFFYLKDRLNRTPVFLMDDVFGELDSFRAGQISKYMKEVGQAFITMTDFTNYDALTKNEKDLLIKVENGKAETVH